MKNLEAFLVKSKQAEETAERGPINTIPIAEDSYNRFSMPQAVYIAYRELLETNEAKDEMIRIMAEAALIATGVICSEFCGVQHHEFCLSIRAALAQVEQLASDALTTEKS